ncbi:hypothetical protein BRSPCE3_44550 [Bradyrhizobium sp. Ce-3]|nr:hypothetical protein BRSPCE3_44550 [Bradyrhizobium sp. Ce-3]
MRPHGHSQRLALAAHLLGLGTGVTVIIGLVPATLALLRALT